MSLLFLFLPLQSFHLSISWYFSLESEWHQVSKTLLSILADLNHAVIWIISTFPLIFKSSNPSVTVSRTLITIGKNINFLFHSFSIHSKVGVFFPLFIFFQFYSVVSRHSKVHNSAGSLFYFIDYNKVWSSGQD